MKKLWIILLSILGGLFVIFISIPFFLSSDIVKDILIKSAEKQMSANLSAEELDISWFGPQKLSKIIYQDKTSKIYIDTLSTNMSFFSFAKTLSNNSFLTSASKTEIKNITILMQTPYKEDIKFTNVYLTIDSKGADYPLKITSYGKTIDNNIEGNFDINIEISKKIPTKKDLAKSVFDIVIKCENFPVAGLDKLLNISKPENYGIITQILGPKMDCEINTKVSNGTGPLKLHLSAVNLNAFLDCTFTNTQIKLNKPFETNFILTEELFRYIFKDKKTLFSGMQSLRPIRIKISDNNFYMPIEPFNLKALHISHATVDLGLLHIYDEGRISKLIDITKDQNYKKTNESTVWFTEGDVAIKNGYLYVGRVDALINYAFQICFWGNVNLMTNYVNMILGLPEFTLSNAFKITDLSDDYVLMMDMKGPFNNVQIDKQSAAIQIGSMLAAQATKGTKGELFGNILGMLGKYSDDQSQVPSAKKPFPWDKYIKKPENEKQSKDFNIFDLFN